MATANEISEFDIMRQRIKERELQRGKEASQQVKGQFASRGMLASGAQIKAQERASQDVARQAREERRDVLVAEAQVNRAQREAEAQREFQRGERLGQQQFAAGQAAEQRGFLSQERIAQESFARAQAEAQRSFTTSERQALQAFQAKQEQGRQDFTVQERDAAQKFASLEAQAQRGFQAEQAQLGRTQQQEQFQATLNQQIAAMNQNAEQFQAEMEINRQATAVNALSALRNAGFAQNQIEAIFRTLGIPGFSIDQNGQVITQPQQPQTVIPPAPVVPGSLEDRTQKVEAAGFDPRTVF